MPGRCLEYEPAMCDSKPGPRGLPRCLAVCAAGAAAVGLVIAAGTGRSAAARRTEAPGATGGAVRRMLLPGPFATAPQPWPSNTLMPPARLSYLRPARIGEKPRRGDAARQKPIRLRPLPDLPELAWESDSSRPYPALPPSSPPAYAASPDPARLSSPRDRTGPDPDRPGLSSDPTLAQSHRAALSAAPELRQKPAPFQRLVIPNPFELAEALELHSPPSDDDPPAGPEGPPPGPTLPVPAKR